MKAVLALFKEQASIETTLEHLREGGYGKNHTAVLSREEAAEVDELVTEDAEGTSAKAALMGAGIGGAIGLAGGLAVGIAPIPGLNMIVWTALLGTVSSAVLGGYFGALLGERAAEGDEMDYKEELMNGNYLLVAHVSDDDEQLVRELVQGCGGYHVDVHEVDEEELVQLSNKGM